jgi:hypothetical protein
MHNISSAQNSMYKDLRYVCRKLSLRGVLEKRNNFNSSLHDNVELAWQGKGKSKVHLEQATKAQRGPRR